MEKPTPRRASALQANSFVYGSHGNGLIYEKENSTFAISTLLQTIFSESQIPSRTFEKVNRPLKELYRKTYITFSYWKNNEQTLLEKS